MIFLVIGTAFFGLLLKKAPDERNISLLRDATALSSEQQTPKASLTPLWRKFICQPQIVVFLCVVLVMGAATSIVENLLFLYMRQDLKAPYSLCGVSVVITVVFEIPLFFLGKKLLSTFGTLNLFLIGMFCYVTRVVCYTLIEIPWTVLLVGRFTGVPFLNFTDTNKQPPG
jgi:MFS_1 like family